MAAKLRSLRILASGVFLLCIVLGGSTPARAQLTVEPSSLSVTVPQGETTAETVTLRNTGAEPLGFCLNFDRPLQRADATLRLSETTVGSACGPLGEILGEVTGQSAGIGWDPSGLTMTPDGRLFAADFSSARTHELTPELEIVRSFEHPFVAEIATHPVTQGLTYNADTGTLWWLNVEQQGSAATPRGLLLEGDLDGVPTGRRIALPRMSGDPPERISPFGGSYDVATARYYFVGAFIGGDSELWAVDSLGTVAPGYPLRPDAYPGPVALGFGPDAHGGASGEAEAVRIEMALSLPGGDGFDRLIVVDREGHDLGIETPLPEISGFGSIEGNPLRSRLDPNGVLYFAFGSFDATGILGIRPHPLPPSWLVMSEWDGDARAGRERRDRH